MTRWLAIVALLAGCRRPVEHAPPPPAAPDAAAMPADAAPPVDAGRDAFAMTDDELRAYCRRPDVRCHPPPKPPPDAAPRFEGKVVAARAADRPTAARRSIVTVGIGRRDGVAASWRGELYRGDRRIGGFAIEQINEVATVGITELAADQIDAGVTVRFTP